MLVYYSPQTEGLGLIKLDQVIKLVLKIHAILPFRFISEFFRIENRRDHPVHVWVYIYIYRYVDMYKSERLLAGIWNEASSYTGCDLIGPSETRAEFRSRSIFFSEPAVGHRDRSPFSEMKILDSSRYRVASPYTILSLRQIIFRP